MSVDNVSISDSVFDLLRFIRGSAHLSNIEITNHRARRNFMDVKQSVIRVNNVKIANFTGTLLKAQDRSSIYIDRSRFSDFTNDQDISTISSSAVTIHSSSFARIDSTFIAASYAQIAVTFSQIRMTSDSGRGRRTHSSSFLDCRNCYNVSIIGSEFNSTTGGDGGAVSVQVSDRSLQSWVSVLYSSFYNCTSSGSGGAVMTDSVTGTLITESVFIRNRANRGGSLYIGCSATVNCSAVVASNGFAYNAAEEGGVIKWTGSRPLIANNSEDHNTAPYGPFVASVPARLHLANTAKELVQVPGLRLLSPVVLELRDSLDQLVQSENRTTVTLAVVNHTGTSRIEVVGLMEALTVQGVANFSSLIIRSRASATLHMKAQSASLGSQSHTVFFDLELRDCVVGEMRTAEGCYPCPRESYSLSVNSTECRQCRPGCTCPGGAVIALASGLWRHSNYTDIIVKCPEESLCFGGNSTQHCAAGQYGRLCGQCVSGYFSFGHFFCYRCLPTPYHLLLICTTIAASTGIAFILIAVTLSEKRVRIAEYGKLILHFLHGLLCVSTLVVGWRQQLSMIFAIIEVLLSLGFAALSIHCLEDSFSWVYFRAIVSSALPIYCVLISVISAAILHRRPGHQSLLVDFSQSLTVLSYQVYPYIIKSAASLVSCRPMESNKYWLNDDLGEQCWTSPHLKYTFLVFVPMAVVYVLAFPLCVLAVAWKSSNAWKRGHCAFLCVAVRERYLRWSAVQVVQQALALTVLAATANTDSVVQVLVCFWSCYFSLAAHIFLRPMRTALGNSVSIAGQAAVCVLAASAFYFQGKLPIEASVTAVIGLILTGAFVLYMLAVTFLYFRVPSAPLNSSGGVLLSAVLRVPVNTSDSLINETVVRTTELCAIRASEA